jgi:hypothetical protein
MEASESFVEELAKSAAGNFLKFSCFALDREIEDLMVPAEDWCIVYTSNRDSDLLTESNEAAILKRLEGHLGWLGDGHDVDTCVHDHWLVGYVTGLYLRVYKGGELTEAFRMYAKAMYDIDQYPVLDSDDHTRRVMEQTSKNVAEVVRRVAGRFDTTDKYEGAGDQAAYLVEDWLSENDEGQLEDEGNGGHPSEESVKDAMVALGFIEEEEREEEGD